MLLAPFRMAGRESTSQRRYHDGVHVCTVHTAEVGEKVGGDPVRQRGWQTLVAKEGR